MPAEIQRARRLFRLTLALALGGAAAVSVALWHRLDRRPTSVAETHMVHPQLRLFAPEYPVSRAFKNEMAQMLKTGKLKPENQELIHNTVVAANDVLDVPPALLWCLLFQESRLNHLKGVGATSAALGLGQFSHFSFFEVNHHLTRFTPDNLFLMQNILGGDPRPIRPTLTPDILASSYFFIPTAVIATASYLNNRYLQLRNILDRRGIDYDSEVLWMQAAMAYNKGTRSVLSLWNETQRRGGKRQVERLTTDEKAFFRAAGDTPTLQRTLKRIWPSASAQRYARELKIHMRNLRACSVRPSDTRSF